MVTCYETRLVTLNYDSYLHVNCLQITIQQLAVFLQQSFEVERKNLMPKKIKNRKLCHWQSYE